jgi:hypothetical protein
MPEILTEDDYRRAAAALGCDVAAIKAVAEVESRGSGFLKDGRLRVLFEGHQFYRYTKGAHAATHPTLCHKNFTSANYCKGDAETRGCGELDRLTRAQELDKRAALMSCSIGKFQIMGFNFALCGYKTVESFWADLARSEGKQLDAFCSYVSAVGIDDELRSHDWAEFARRYNGPAYKKNQYDTKLAKAWQRHKLSA